MEPVAIQIEDLLSLEDGWQGEGSLAPSAKHLRWLLGKVWGWYAVGSSVCAVCPTFEGNVSLEWSREDSAAILDVNLEEHSGSWLWFERSETGKEENRELDLNSTENWIWLSSQIENRLKK